MRFINIIFNLFGNQDGFTFSLVHKRKGRERRLAKAREKTFISSLKPKQIWAKVVRFSNTFPPKVIVLQAQFYEKVILFIDRHKSYIEYGHQ